MDSVRFAVSAGETHLEAVVNEKQLSKSVQSMLIEPFLSAYNKQNGTKFSKVNCFNVAVEGEELPQSVEAVLAYPCKTLVHGNGSGSTKITINLQSSANLKVSAGELHTEVTMETKHLKDTVASAIVEPFLSVYNKQSSTKKKKSDVKGLVFDGDTPLESIGTLMSSKVYAIIRDPRHTEVRILL